MLKGFRRKFIGDKIFYKNVLVMVVPMIMQMVVTNFVSMIDNIMLGQIGTEQMSGASIVNQFVFVFNITTFGAVSGPSIFGAQYFGKGDHRGQMYTFRFRLIECGLIVLAGAAVFGVFDDQLISLFISKDDSPEKIADTLYYGKIYMSIMLFGLIPFGIGQAYSSVVRECGETKIPMSASMAAVAVNLLLDYGLIFGKLGMPEMGVKGAAVATVAAKFIEAAVVIIWVHTHPQRNLYIKGVFKSFGIPSKLIWDMMKKGTPLLVNEFLWAAGMSVIAQCYSVRGLDVVAARNISSTITNLFGAVYIQLGVCTGILVGAKLGANKLKDARDLDNKLLFFSVVAGVCVSLAILPIAKVFPELYKTEKEVRELASFMIVTQALSIPMWSYTNACYFTLRSGGKTGITFMFDFGFSWLLIIPLTLILTYLTDMDIHPLFIVGNFSEIIKVVIGFFLVRSDLWMNNIVDDKI